MRKEPLKTHRQLDKKHFDRQGEREDVVVGNSADSYLIDARGRKYIDFMMGWCVGVSAEEDVLMLLPALAITRETAQRGLDIFERSL